MNRSSGASPSVFPALVVSIIKPRTQTLPFTPVIWSATKYYGSDLDQTCGPPSASHITAFVFLVVFCSHWCNSLQMVSLPLGTFLSTLPPQSLQNSNYNIPLLNTISWCPKFYQLRVYIRITWVLFPKFTFLSSTHNLMNQNLLGIGYRVWKRFLVNLMHHPVEESLPYKVKAKLLSIAVKELQARADSGWLGSSATPISTSDSRHFFFFNQFPELLHWGKLLRLCSYPPGKCQYVLPDAA